MYVGIIFLMIPNMNNRKLFLQYLHKYYKYTTLQKCSFDLEFWNRWGRSNWRTFLFNFAETWNAHNFINNVNYTSIYGYIVSKPSDNYSAYSYLVTYYRFWIILPKPSEQDIAHALEIQKIVNKEELKNPKEVIKKKLLLIPGLMKYIIPFSLVYLFEYFINQGTVSILKKYTQFTLLLIKLHCTFSILIHFYNR